MHSNLFFKQEFIKFPILHKLVYRHGNKVVTILKFIVSVIIHILITVLAVIWNRSRENKQDRLLYIALMIGGFLWSQLQTEYLIWRINKKTEIEAD